MSAPERCEELRGLASELALGIADGQERAGLLDHVADCADCRNELEQLSILADDLLLLAPEHEPPLGFELRALRALQPRPRAARRRRARLVPALAAALVAAAVTAGTLLLAFRDDRQLAGQYRATLARAHGSAFTAAQLRTVAGRPAGTVFLYRGSPSWIMITVEGRYRSRVERAELVSVDGRPISLETFRLGSGSWGGTLPADPKTLHRLRLLAAGGRIVLTAYLPRDW